MTCVGTGVSLRKKRDSISDGLASQYTSGIMHTVRPVLSNYIYLLYPEGNYDTRYWLSADVIMKRIPKHDDCCGADSAVAGANGGGCHRMTASVGTGEYVTHGIILLRVCLCDSTSMTTHANPHAVSMMTNVQQDFIDDAERELFSPLRVLPKVLLMFKRVYFVFYNGFTLFYIFHCATYTLLCFVCYL